MPTYLEFDPNDAAFMRNPYPVLNALREEAPIFWHEATGMWFVSRYDDLYTLLRDRRLGRQITHIMPREALGLPPRNPDYAPFYMLSDNSMFDKEPPDHTRIKNLVHKVFTPRRVESLRGQIQQIADDLLDAVESRGEMDLLEDYAVPLPVMVIAALLGVPEADRHKLRPWSADIVRMFELNHTEETAQQAVRAAQEFTDYLRALSRQRRDDPRDDLISALAAVEDDGDTLSEDELIATCVLLLNAGHEATVNGFGNGMLALLNHPEQLERLKTHPELLRTTVEEMLRYDAPLQLFRRWVLEDMTYRGHDFKLGQEIAFLFGAANRDPETFTQPNTFDIARDPNPHITFGVGIHYCLGAPLARMELNISFATLLRRLPHLELIEEPRFKPSFVLRGLEAFHVCF
ncbi:MAG: cytochrome P450 [Chloroflexi bacterium]|nr:MAG: cytochrome P450 [Chloroflexota bacterium]